MARSLESIAAQMAEQGIDVPSLDALRVTNGQGYCRFTSVGSKKKQAAWCVIYERTDRNGKRYFAGSFGEGGNGPFTIQPDRSEKEVEKKIFAAESATIQKQTEESREQLAERAARKSQAIWDRAVEDDFLVGGHRYLVKKGVRAYGLRASVDGKVLYVPLRKKGKVVGIQSIRETEDGFVKRFLQYTATKGAHHVLGEVTSETPTVFVCEGYATGAAIHEATGIPVVVAFFCHNLHPVIESLRAAFPKIRIINAGDDDRHTRQRCLRFFSETYGVRVQISPLRKGEAAKWEHHTSPVAGEMNLSVSEVREGKLRRIVAAFDYMADGKSRLVNRKWENAGREAAAKLWTDFNVPTIFPVFRNRKSTGTDFDDLLLEDGRDACRDQLVKALDSSPKEINSEIDIDWAVDRFSLIYGKGVFWDSERFCRIRVDHAKLQWPDTIKALMSSNRRKIIDERQLVFRPDGIVQEGEINTFDHFPIKPDSSKPCDLIVEHLKFLCGTPEVFDWVSKWLAYPLQHPGAKMHQALVFHGVREGTGKNLFFSVMERIYGEYSTVINQAMLNSDFNEYLSRRLFIVADEVLTQQDRRHQKGMIKGMITGTKHQLNEKNMPRWTEDNLTNFVFLSNELQPLALDPEDRRFMVVKVEESHPQSYFQKLAAQIEAGGAAGFYAWLLAVDLEDFGPSTRPCLTEARQDLIELGKPASDRFIEAWLAGDTLFPIKACALECLYDAFVLWRARGGDLSRENRLQFSKRISRFGLEKRRMRVELWPNWYDPEDHSGLPPGKIRSQQQVFLPADSDPAKANEEILDFQVVVNRARKDLKRV